MFTDEMENSYFEETEYTCDTCDKDFFSQDMYDKHISEHRTCNLDGCTFTAHEKIIETHIRMQHSTGLYDKIRNISTPEDIAKWIQDRKKKYPNKENIEKRYKEQEEKISRGERIPKNQNRFGKDKFRLRKAAATPQTSSKQIKRKKANKHTKPVSLINEKSDWNGSMFPFRGTSELYKEETTKPQSDFEDDEWEATNKSCAPTIKLNNALGSLMAAYGSDDEFDDVLPDEKVEDQSVQLNTEVSKAESDNEPPDEIKIDKSPAANSESSSNIEPKQPANNSSMENSKKRRRKRPGEHQIKWNRNKAMNSRDIGDNKIHNNADCAPSTSGRGFNKSNDFPYKFKKRRVTLLEKLLENEIRHERNMLLQCVRYVVQNKFFKDHK